jgi:hypothetical protein
VEYKIRLFAKLMSLLFALMAVYALVDLALSPKESMQYVMAHESESGYRSTSKYGASYFRDNYLHCIPFRVQVPYRLRPTNEIDTLLTYQSVEKRAAEAQMIWSGMDDRAKQEVLCSDGKSTPAEFEVVKVPVDLQTYYDVEDGDSIRLFVSPWRHKIRGVMVHTTASWRDVDWSNVKAYMKMRNPGLSQWILTTVVFAFISLALSALTWGIKTFQYSVGLFVFNCVISALLHWVY